MTTKIQKQVAQFVEHYELSTTITYRMLDLVSETGELSKELLKATDYGKSPFNPTENWEGELGDVLFSLICVANSSGIDLEKALTNALNKYRTRIESKGDSGSGR